MTSWPWSSDPPKPPAVPVQRRGAQGQNQLLPGGDQADSRRQRPGQGHPQKPPKDRKGQKRPSGRLVSPGVEGGEDPEPPKARGIGPSPEQTGPRRHGPEPPGKTLPPDQGPEGRPQKDQVRCAVPPGAFGVPVPGPPGRPEHRCPRPRGILPGKAPKKAPPPEELRRSPTGSTSGRRPDAGIYSPLWPPLCSSLSRPA